MGTPNHSPPGGRFGGRRGAEEKPLKGMPVLAQQTLDAQSRGVGGDSWGRGASSKLPFGWVSCEGLGGQQAPLQRAGEHPGENFASLCPLMTRAGVSDQEARSPGGPGWAEARAAGGQPAVRVRGRLVSGLPRTKLSATAFQGSKKKEVCVCGARWGESRAGRRCFHASCLICIR